MLRLEATVSPMVTRRSMITCRSLASRMVQKSRFRWALVSAAWPALVVAAGLADGGIGNIHIGLGDFVAGLVRIESPEPTSELGTAQLLAALPFRPRPGRIVALICSRLAAALCSPALACSTGPGPPPGRRHKRTRRFLPAPFPPSTTGAIVDGLAIAGPGQSQNRARPPARPRPHFLGFEGAGGADGGDQVAAIDGRSAKGGFAAVMRAPVPAENPASEGEQDKR